MSGFFGIDNELLLILLFIAIFSTGGFGYSSQGTGGFFGRDEDLIFFIILLLIFYGVGFFGFGRGYGYDSE